LCPGPGPADDTERLSHRLGWIAPNLDRQQCGMSAIAAEDREELRDAGALLERVAHQAARLGHHVRVELGHDQPDMSKASGIAARCVPPPADPPLVGQPVTDGPGGAKPRR
jgi:hypothetical protein